MPNKTACRFVSCLAVTAFLATGCGSKSLADSSTADEIAPATAATTSAPEPACVESAVSNPEQETGADLEVGTTFSTENGLDYVIPENARNDFPELVAGDWTGDSSGVVDRALSEGAFAYGNPQIFSWISNNSGSDITITGIRAVNTRTVCLPDGYLLLFGNQAGDVAHMAMNFDADRPTALQISDPETTPTVPFFDEYVIEVPDGDTQDLIIHGLLARNARTFDIALTYLRDGEEYTQIVRQENGQEFRVAPTACPDTAAQASLEDTDIERLRAHRYSGAFRQAEHSGMEHINMETVTYDQYLQTCTY
ncbi:hypothetical protein AB0F81_23130 [Actinoplanes sp. NPDC024001]|uniref:hypothetical protein n=1 Tax=Actinoplanes sp. NPDC024001 TaxID=3154598 RepID=UPI0033E511F1